MLCVVLDCYVVATTVAAVIVLVSIVM